jgi:phage terminase small subunit
MPQYIPGAPEMPSIVAENEQAKWYWNWCCKVLDDAGVLTTACLPLLTLHALDWAQLMWLYEATKDGNIATIGATGGPITSPEATQLHAHANRFIKELSELGLTPASKSKIISAGKKKEPDSFAEMLARRMGPKAN